MSAPQSIADVTIALADRLLAALKELNVPGDDLVTIGPPDAMRKNKTGPQLNLFLYQTAIDPAWRNQNLPAPGRGGQRYPLLPLRLHYLLTVYGHEEGDQKPKHDELVHKMLGGAMLQFHTNPAVPLNGQPDPVRVTPLALGTDDLSKLWAGFQTPYRLSVAYEAAVVAIEPAVPVHFALPVIARGNVRDVGVHVRPGVADPVIAATVPPVGLEGVRFLAQPTPAVPPDDLRWFPDLLALTGTGFDSSGLQLVFTHPRLNNRVATLKPTRLRSDAKLAFRLPHGLESVTDEVTGAAVPPVAANWPPGSYTVAAARVFEINDFNPDGTALKIRRLTVTAPVPFAVLPAVRTIGPPAPLTLTFTATTGELSVPLLNPVAEGQQVSLFVGPVELVGTVELDDGGTTVRWRTDKPAEVKGAKAALDRVPAGGRFLRVRVDGADSSLLAEPEVGKQPVAPFDRQLLVRVVTTP